jgi:hypothetical protein
MLISNHLTTKQPRRFVHLFLPSWSSASWETIRGDELDTNLDTGIASIMIGTSPHGEAWRGVAWRGDLTQETMMSSCICLIKNTAWMAPASNIIHDFGSIRLCGVYTCLSVKCVCPESISRGCYTTITANMRKCLYSEVASGKSGLKRNRARSTESHGSEEPLTRETLLAVTAPTIKSCCSVSLEGSKLCSADVSVNSPHIRPTRAGENTLKLTYRPVRSTGKPTG